MNSWENKLFKKHTKINHDSLMMIISISIAKLELVLCLAQSKIYQYHASYLSIISSLIIMMALLSNMSGTVYYDNESQPFESGCYMVNYIIIESDSPILILDTCSESEVHFICTINRTEMQWKIDFSRHSRSDISIRYFSDDTVKSRLVVITNRATFYTFTSR